MTSHIALLAGIQVLAQVALPTAQANAQPASKPNPLAFVADGTNGFTFDTGVLRGKLRANGRANGFSVVTHIPSGATLDGSMGLFGHYRVFTVDKRYGTGAWDWPGDAKLRTDGAVEALWPATEERPFELRAVYRLAASNALDVETILRARTNLVKFESFLASYFAGSFTNSLVYVADPPDKLGVPGFMAAGREAGVWLMFPRDDAAETIIRDGRWTRPPSPVDWVKMPRLAKPLGMRRDPATGLTAVLMSPPKDCFAISTPFQTETHYSMYLSLFGRDLKSGKTDRARARLLITPHLASDEIIRYYDHYVKEIARR